MILLLIVPDFLESVAKELIQTFNLLTGTDAIRRDTFEARHFTSYKVAYGRYARPMIQLSSGPFGSNQTIQGRAKIHIINGRDYQLLKLDRNRPEFLFDPAHRKKRTQDIEILFLPDGLAM